MNGCKSIEFGSQIVRFCSTDQVGQTATETSDITSWQVGFEFIGRLLEATAWPATILLTAWIFRAEIRKVTSGLKSLKWGDKEAIFEGLEKAKSEAKTLDPVEPDIANENEQQTASLLRRAEKEPLASLLDAWLQVEETVRGLLETGLKSGSLPSSAVFGLTPRRLNMTTFMNFAKRHELLSEAETKTLNWMRETRNRAVHSAENSVTPAVARDFILVADQLIDSLKRNLREPEVVNGPD